MNQKALSELISILVNLYISFCSVNILGKWGFNPTCQVNLIQFLFLQAFPSQ